MPTKSLNQLETNSAQLTNVIVKKQANKKCATWQRNKINKLEKK